MKKLFLLVTLFIPFLYINAQQIDNIDSLYQDKASYLIKNEVISVDSANSQELQKRVKEWASVAFVNLKEVLVGETENQLTFVYLTESFYLTTKLFGKEQKTSYPWYIRLVVQTKDDKVRMSFFDDGNASMTGQIFVSARSYKLASYIFPEGKNREKYQKNYSPGLYSIRESVLSMLRSCKSSVITQPKETW